MSPFHDPLNQRGRIYDALCKERDAIVSQGGERVPDSVIQECMDLRGDFAMNIEPSRLKQAILSRFEPYRQSTTAAQAERRAELKTAALKSSRFTVLRMKRGLPFKSRRQP